MGNYVIGQVGNYVIANPSDLGNFMIVDTHVVGCSLQRRGLGERLPQRVRCG